MTIGAALCTLCLAIQISHAALVRSVKALTQAHPLISESLFLDPWAVKRLTLGYDHLLADCYWLMFIQYAGDGKARRVDHYALAYNYLDLITTLDPGFKEAYSFAAFTVGAEQGRPDLADKLIQRGFKANPNDWYIPFIAGVNQYLYAHNDKDAAQYYRMAANYPNAPAWLGRQAEILEREIPSIIKQINTWNNIYVSNEFGAVQIKAREKLIALWLKVFLKSPTQEIKARAKHQLQALGVNPPEPEERW